MKKAFTLAEVLVTLVIIGIVASMTIPNLLSKSNDDGLKAQWKKTYGDLSQAYMSILAENGGSPDGLFEYSNGGSEDLKNLFKDKMGIIKECNSTGDYGGSGNGASIEGCWHSANKWFALNRMNIPGDSPISGLVLNNGSLMIIQSSFEIHYGDAAPGGYDSIGMIMVDVNGFKEPNIWGKDIFSLYMAKNRLVPEGALGKSDPSVTCIENSTEFTNMGMGCAAKYLYE